MNLTGITWRGESIDDAEILGDLPLELARIHREVNGFILYNGAFHFRGACQTPQWHSLRAAWRGPMAFCVLYEGILPKDIPFAQDQLGDQFLLRDGTVLRLSAETGEIKFLAGNLDEFFKNVSDNIEEYLNVSLCHKMKPGQLLFVYPPFCFQESGHGASLEAISADEAIGFHADLARQIRDIPDGEQIKFKVMRRTPESDIPF